MKVRIAATASDEEAAAIAAALAEHVGSDVEVYVGDGDEPAATHQESSGPEPTGDDASDDRRTDALEPTDREALLWDEIEDILEGGPKKYREQLEDGEKLFVRDRLDLWFGGDDGDLLFEDGKFAAFDDWHPRGADADDETDDRLPADGLITGAAEFEGRDVHFMANDYTVKRGSMAAKGVEKFLRMQQRALKTGQPVLYLMDSSGGRIDQQTGFFANREGIGKYYYNHSMLSGRVPQICVLYGPCIAGAAYTPVFADFTIMVEGMSAMAIASPRMVQMVTGEDIDLEELGGPAVHARESGSADLVARDEEHARELVALVMSANPHDGSSAHGNVALAVRGAVVHDLLRSEQAVLAL
ncbi:carboxyl transferase domain-containing protein, partial [Natronococcus sp.]|uniref:carboxyl transferase domain-containing protein n=1 Tax=Natronococcus sp. TaxID=35747 RepID=UPI003A4DCF2A